MARQGGLLFGMCSTCLMTMPTLPGSARRLPAPLFETRPIEPEQQSLPLGIARPAARGAARWLRGEYLRPPFTHASPHVSLELVVVDQRGRASRSIPLRASASELRARRGDGVAGPVHRAGDRGRIRSRTIPSPEYRRRAPCVIAHPGFEREHGRRGRRARPGGHGSRMCSPAAATRQQGDSRCSPRAPATCGSAEGVPRLRESIGPNVAGERWPARCVVRFRQRRSLI